MDTDDEKQKIEMLKGGMESKFFNHEIHQPHEGETRKACWALRDMSRRGKAATCRRSPQREEVTFAGIYTARRWWGLMA